MNTRDRALNRATLARQLLLHRHSVSTVDAIGQLAGLQAQTSDAPYLGLWSRVDGFALADLTARLEDRSVVRGSVLRGTQHLFLGEDYRWLRPLVAPVLARARQAAFGKRTAGMDLDELAEVITELLTGRTLTRTQLRTLLAKRWPDRDAEALAWSAPALVPIVHPPPNGTWRRGGPTPFTLASEWLGEPVDTRPDPARLVHRYLAAFGPASVADMQQWSGVRGLAEVVAELDLDRLPGDLFDLPDAPRPDPDQPAPVRLLPEFDNLIVAYADRTRIMPDDYRKRVCVGSLVAATVLVDGKVRGTWQLTRSKGTPAVRLDLFERLPKRDHEAVTAEVDRLLDFVREPTSVA